MTTTIKRLLALLFPLWFGTAEEQILNELRKAKKRQADHEAKAAHHTRLAKFYRTTALRLAVHAPTAMPPRQQQQQPQA